MALRDKQIRFCEEYVKDFNATQAAIRAGYSKKTAHAMGWENLRKPEIKAAIEGRLKELSLSADETLKAISDIARSSLNDYFTVKETIQTPQVFIPLAQYIRQLEAEIEDADKFITRAGITDQQTLETHQEQQKQRRFEIIKLKIELERSPKAKRIVNGEPELVKVAELDMPRLVSDKAAGKIKAIKHTEHGLNVELYAADAALRDLARVHGLFNDKLTVDAGGELMNLYKTVMKRK
jgi:phage terminase small subunit